ncbi:beta-ketoacyl-[acyl-carrier-protein] synthase family protein [Salidesulfovibrio onnuriiensis]|uniref:beta-ketoacyl-[acyl-carrier-protein] synthase family protein n=1 Tax=Salidesulfovibrio onnuriiensis TaxID=2583823 RepID=UPI0011CCB328|nr:beta-ketoacyl-[acyl-carrier-protein] synthase family protein [Salidesulfovibrio onnuriiensis]
MRLNKVVITGLGAISPFGTGMDTLMNSLTSGQSGVRIMEELGGITGLRPRIGGKVLEYDAASIHRKYRRSMSAMSIFAVLAANEALAQAGLDTDTIQGGRTGLCVSSTIGSTNAMQSFFASFLDGMTIEGIRSTEFFKIMNHSCAANLTQYFGITGRVMAPSAACSTGAQAIGLAAESIALGKQEIMLCGGADELHPLTVSTFDIIEAASTGYNDRPEATPRPFDADRDGIACSEGAGMIVLESLESAQKRGATILAELAGFASTADPSNMASPSDEAIRICMEKALADGEIAPGEVDYVNAHATGTVLGDAAESKAIAELFANRPPVSSLKGHLGHTMAASGALELAATVRMMMEKQVVPTRNLESISPECKDIYLPLKLQGKAINVALKNSFALGGINTSIALRRP